MTRQEGQSDPAAQPTSAELAEQGAAAADAAEAGTSSASLEEQIEALRAEKDEHFRGWQRAQADFMNYRRRVEQERAELQKNAEAGLIFDVLPVLDDLERAIAGLPAELRGLTWVDGVLLIERKLAATLERHGLTPIEALGNPFDPNEHEAVLRDGEPADATTVTGELQRGYRLHDRVLRPTLVKVGPAPHSNER